MGTVLVFASSDRARRFIQVKDVDWKRFREQFQSRVLFGRAEAISMQFWPLAINETSSLAANPSRYKTSESLAFARLKYHLGKFFNDFK